MYKICILSVNKTKEQWLEEATCEYVKRLQAVASIEFVWCKTDDELVAKSLKASHLICLDPLGEELDSLQFSSFLLKQLQEAGCRLTIVIGGPLGLPQALKGKYLMVSLSKLTFTHQIVRLVLIEQIYRSFELFKGSKYHKG